MPIELADTCLWRENDSLDCDFWETECGNDFILMEGTPEDNQMKFCCYCGKPLRHERRPIHACELA